MAESKQPEAVSLTEQRACVLREIGQRGRVYPRLVRDGRMTQAEANRQTAHMCAVVRTIDAAPLLFDAVQSLRQALLLHGAGATIASYVEQADVAIRKFEDVTGKALL